jgi:hypothetical protein
VHFCVLKIFDNKVINSKETIFLVKLTEATIDITFNYAVQIGSSGLTCISKNTFQFLVELEVFDNMKIVTGYYQSTANSYQTNTGELRQVILALKAMKPGY